MSYDDLGVLIVGHGTRDPFGQAQMRTLACQTAGQLAPLKTELGFLELADPTIEAGIARLAASGVRRLITVPVLLFRAGHADHDIPEAVHQAAEKHAIQVLAQTGPLEHQRTVIELSAERFRQALAQAGQADCAPDHIALAMISRGSSSDSAAQAMQEFANARVQRTPVSAYSVGYVAVRQPNVPQSLDWLSQTSAQVLVVQPHLLFEGEVYHGLKQRVTERQTTDLRPWIVCQPLGAAADDFEDQRLAEVLAGLVHATLPPA